MPNANNKVKFGLKNCYYAIVTSVYQGYPRDQNSTTMASFERSKSQQALPIPDEAPVTI
jgi:hypothetical protein